MPTWRTLQEHFKLIVQKRREYVKKQEKASGATKEYGAFETFLDAMIREMDGKKDQDILAKDAEEQKKKQLREAGEMVRGAAAKRVASDAEGTSGVKPTVKKVKVERADLADVALQELDLMRKRTGLDKRRIAIEEKREDMQAAQTEALLEAIKALTKKK